MSQNYLTLRYAFNIYLSHLCQHGSLKHELISCFQNVIRKDRLSIITEWVLKFCIKKLSYFSVNYREYTALLDLSIKLTNVFVNLIAKLFCAILYVLYKKELLTYLIIEINYWSRKQHFLPSIFRTAFSVVGNRMCNLWKSSKVVVCMHVSSIFKV